MMKVQFVWYVVAFTAFALLLGCDAKQSKTASDSSKSADRAQDAVGDQKDHSEAGHSHGAGPHDGTIADWGGGKFHAEFTVDHDKQEATVYILAGDEKTLAPIDAAEITVAIKDPDFHVELKANSQAGDSDGKASRFVGNHENFGIVREYEGSISGTVDGTPYSGYFKEAAHDD